MTTLDDLALKYGSDKTPALKHHYTEFYESYLGGRRAQIRTVVEIGIGYPEVMVGSQYQIGASLRMWRDFFPNAIVWGADLEKRCMFEDDRIHTVLCDQRQTKDLRGLLHVVGSRVDLFVDDGSHAFEDQIETATFLVPQLPVDCLYFIEDVSRPSTVSDALRSRGFSTMLLESDQRKHHDDRLLRVWR